MRLKTLLTATTLLFAALPAFSQWHELGTAPNTIKTLSNIYNLFVDGSGNVYAHGSFYDSTTTPATTYAVAKWNGTSWSKHSNIQPFKLYLSNANNLYCSVPTDSGENGIHREWNVLKWNGARWDTLGAPNNKLNANHEITLMYETKGGKLLLSGSYRDSADLRLGPGVYQIRGRGFIAMWTGSTWDTLDKGTSRLNIKLSTPLQAFTDDNLGNIYAIGAQLRDTAGSPYPYAYYYVAKFNGTGWSKAGSGVNGGFYANGHILSIACDQANNLYAAGAFYDTAQFPAQPNYVAKWNGTTWSQLGQGGNSLNANASIYNIALDSKNNVYASGLFFNSIGNYVAKWNGTTWSNYGNYNFNGEINSMVVDKADNVYVSGRIKNSSQKYYVAKYGPATTGIGEHRNSLGWSVYPNPAATKLIIEGAQGASAILTNSIGQRAMQFSINVDKQVTDISKLPAGMYILQLTDADGNRGAMSIVKQ